MTEERFAHWVGQKVHYTSRSGKKYVAMIDVIPENPVHGWTDLPTVSLSFRDERGKLVRKGRVMPRSERYRRKVWEPLPPANFEEFVYPSIDVPYPKDPWPEG